MKRQLDLFGISEERLSISEASHFLGVSIDTIRRWEKKGLVKTQRTTRGSRTFLTLELSRLKAKLSSPTVGSFQVLRSEEKTKYKVVELFTGAGGLALGLENAGLNLVLAVEIDKDATETLRLNRPTWNVVTSDISNVNFDKINADIVTGGFPCQAFSYAGNRMGFEDTRGTLFFEFARSIKEINPQVILGENVRGLERHEGGKTLNVMLSVLRELGYRVKYRVLRAQYLDVPQKRERLVIIGVRNDLSLPILFPKEKDYTVSLRDALNEVPESEGQRYTDKKEKILSLVPEGGYWRDLPEKLQKTYMGKSFYLGGGKTGMARRLSWDEPSLTLTCNPAQKQTERCHPSHTRPLTIREYARIQSFPDGWNFVGSVASRYRQIGNAVPVNLGFHIGRCLISMLENKPDLETMEIEND